MLTVILEKVEKLLKEYGYKIIKTTLYKDFGWFIYTSRGNFCITYKDWYKKFADHIEGQKGYGGLASVDILAECVRKDALFVFGLSGLNLYCIDPSYFLEKGIQVPHLPDNIALPSSDFTNFEKRLEEEYLDWI